MRKLFIVALLSGVGVLGISCKGYTSRQITNPAAAVARLKAGGNLKSEVDRLAEPLIACGEIHDLAVGVLTPDGAEHCFGYGGTPLPDANTIFEIGSVTKAFVASVFVILAEEGKLNYNDTVRSILPPTVKVNDLVGDLTLYELAVHTSGLPREPHTLGQMRYIMDFEFAGRNPYGFINKPYLYGFLHNSRVELKKDRGYAYSNMGYGLLAHLMELKTGRSLPELIEEKICGPLKMRDTGFTLTDEQRSRKAIGHVGDAPKFLPRNRPMRQWDMGEIMRASGGMYSTVHDLMIFAQSNLGLTGQPLDARLALTHDAVINMPEEDISCGWMINHYPAWGANLTFINGILSGYSAYLGMDTEKKVAVVVLITNFNWVDKVGHNLLLRVAAASGSEKGIVAHNASSPTENLPPTTVKVR